MIDAALIRSLLRQPPVPVENSLADLDDDALVARVRAMAHLKRFFECYCGDPDFRTALAANPEAALADRGLHVLSEDVNAFLAAQDSSSKSESTENLSLYRNFHLEMHGSFGLIEMASQSPNHRYARWRTRQLARLRFEFSAAGDYIVRPAIAFELSKGCSAGCWFCAISAGKLERNLDYETRAELWRGVLSETARLLGTAAASGFCYWATDALDNPDYERFATDFHQNLGAFPPTTTALALKNPSRTRSLLALSQHSGCRLNRFSVLTTPMLRRIHREFSAEELALVDLVLQNPGAHIFYDFPRTQAAPKILAGRVFDNPGEATKRNMTSVAGTIACITGFLINMVEGSIQLVSPCTASTEFPLGYRVHGERMFRTADEFGTAMQSLIDSHMPESLPDSMPLRLRDDVGLTPLRDGFRLWSAVHSVEFRGRDEAEIDLLKKLGEAIRGGHQSASDISERELLDRVYQSGAFNDLPIRRSDMPVVISQAGGTQASSLTEAHCA
jgi:radical SAM family RiPP maturation amino acid epimerase